MPPQNAKPSSGSPFRDMTAPVIADGLVLVAGRRSLLWRAAVPLLVLAAAFFALGIGQADRPLVAARAVGALFVVVACARVWLWSRGLAARALVATQTHLVLTRHGKPERWIEWGRVTTVAVHKGDLLPEWHRTSNTWFTVTVEPAVAVDPPSAFVGDLAAFLVAGRERDLACARIAEECSRHGVLVREER